MNLEPVRAALLRRAHADAAAVRAEAAQSRTRLLGDARAEGERILREARSKGHADAARLAQAEEAHTRRAAHALVLSAQRDVYDELCRRVAGQLRAELDGGRLGPALAARAAAVLGPDARVEPAPGGGFTAHLGHRRADCSIASLTRQAVESAGTAAELWR
ncbi:hypothetical protein ABT369_10210 [Dactylosporangium sp. NPDC000244]|uniref:hypothetical protein n=1 Tax=Dactylosporangium sp. NPDC000244 TaxID=3154365 RepID=UPI003316FEE7